MWPMFEGTVTFDIQMIKGIKQYPCLGGEGLFPGHAQGSGAHLAAFDDGQQKWPIVWQSICPAKKKIEPENCGSNLVQPARTGRIA